MKWATIQTFRDNRVPMRKHIVMILTNFTTKKHIYTAACMAVNRLTLVGTLQQIEKALKRNPIPRRPAVLLVFTIDPTKRIT